MRLWTLLVLLALANTSNASFFASKKKALDAEGNCVPELVAENARLYGEIEKLDQIAKRAEAQLKSTVKESNKSGFESLKELSTKAKATRVSIKSFQTNYADAACKVAVVKAGKPETKMFIVNQAATEFDKLAATYEQVADGFLKSHLAKK